MKKNVLSIVAILALSLSALAQGGDEKVETKGIPGNRGAEHIGFTVPNLKEAVDFFENVIGAEVLFEIGPFASDDNWMEEHLNVHPRARIPKAAFVKCANGANLEIFEYESPDQVKRMPKNSDWGGHHIAFYVDNMDEAVKYLKSKGVKVQGEPITMTEGPNAGVSWVYFLSPWGMQLELVSYENGQAYEKTTTKRAFTPKKL